MRRSQSDQPLHGTRFKWTRMLYEEVPQVILRPDHNIRRQLPPIQATFLPANGGREAEIPFRTGEHGRTWHANNGDVVPYNAVLSLLFDCHINVECVHSSVSVKYLYKYIFKGGDKITVFIRGNDEIEQYLNARVISASEACYKIAGLQDARDPEPNVETLPCHCAGEQIMFFNNLGELQQGFNPPDTRLTEFFKLCEPRRVCTYAKVPRGSPVLHDLLAKTWQRRKQGHQDQSGNDFVTDTVGRIPTVAFTPNQAETYYLRMLLVAVPGPTSYEDLKTSEWRAALSLFKTLRERMECWKMTVRCTL